MIPHSQDSRHPETHAFGFWAGFVGTIIAAVLLVTGVVLIINAQVGKTNDAFPLDKACYTVIDKAGLAHKSWFPPIPAADVPGVYSFNNDHTWGYVFGPAAEVADRDCLRERYAGQPDLIPPLEGSDEKP